MPSGRQLCQQPCCVALSPLRKKNANPLPGMARASGTHRGQARGGGAPTRPSPPSGHLKLSSSKTRRHLPEPAPARCSLFQALSPQPVTGKHCRSPFSDVPGPAVPAAQRPPPPPALSQSPPTSPNPSVRCRLPCLSHMWDGPPRPQASLPRPPVPSPQHGAPSHPSPATRSPELGTHRHHPTLRGSHGGGPQTSVSPLPGEQGPSGRSVPSPGQPRAPGTRPHLCLQLRLPHLHRLLRTEHL